MSSEDAALVPLWAEPDDAVGEALKAVYEDIPGHVVGLIEFHRIEATNDYLKNMCESRDALAPYGKFKDWCDAGVNYGAVSKALSRAPAMWRQTRGSHTASCRRKPRPTPGCYSQEVRSRMTARR